MVWAKVTISHPLSIGLESCGLWKMSCFLTSPMLYGCPGLCVAAAQYGDLLGTARGAIWPRMGYSSHSFEIFQERNEVFCYDLAVFS